MIDRSEDLATVLEDLGVEIKRFHGDEIQGRCPVHHLVKGRPSSRYSWYMNSESGLYICHTCGARGNLPILISQLTGDDNVIVAVQSLLIRNGLERLTAPREREEYIEVDWMRYSQFSPLPASMVEHRNVDPRVAHLFGIRWDKAKKMMIMPIVSPLGELMGWQAKNSGTFLNVPEGVHKGMTLFGIERATERACMLLESPLDVVRFHSVCPASECGISALASFGANVSDEQVALITSRFDKLVMALDNDKAGKLESRRLAKVWPSFRKGIRYLNYNFTEAKDIGDMDDREIRAAVSNLVVVCP